MRSKPVVVWEFRLCPLAEIPGLFVRQTTNNQSKLRHGLSFKPFSCFSFFRLASEKPGSTIKLSEWWNMDTQCKNFTKQDLTKDVLESVERPVIELTAT